MKTILFSLLAVVFAVNANNATAGGKKEKVTIQTTAQCGACETRITAALREIDGFKSVKFSPTKAVTIKYDSSVTNADAFRNAIANVGYDADAVPGNADAYAKLPACCQKGGHSH